jgi:hypothetical protein
LVGDASEYAKSKRQHEYARRQLVGIAGAGIVIGLAASLCWIANNADSFYWDFRLRNFDANAWFERQKFLKKWNKKWEHK